MPRVRAALPDLSTTAAQEAALKDLEEDMYADSSVPVVRTRRLTVEAIFAAWSLDFLRLKVLVNIGLGQCLRTISNLSKDMANKVI